jgi:outer membrane protein TolC
MFLQKKFKLLYKNRTYKLTVREKQVDALNKATDYSDELANYLEVLNVKDNALNAELSLIDNKFQQYKAIILLYRALGGGWL